MKKLIIGRTQTLALSLCIILLSSCSLEFMARGAKTGSTQASCLLRGQAEEGFLIAVVSLGWHSGILINPTDLPKEMRELFPEFKRHSMVEIGWGDRGFYMAPGFSVRKGIRAALFSSGSVLHLAGFDQNLGSYLAGSDVVWLKISTEGFNRLLDTIVKSVVKDEHGRPIRLGAALYGDGSFYEANGDFSLLYTCNSWTSNVLKESGCDIRGSSRSAPVLKQLRKLETAPINQR